MIVFHSNAIKVKKNSSKRYIGVARIFDWRKGSKRKSHAMTLFKFFKKRDFLGGQRYRKMEDQKSGLGMACNLDFAKLKRFELKLKKVSKIV